mgnify:CR=1 FL=1
MSEQEFLSGFCPKCGESLKVPAKLSQFSCMYCGARLTADELLDKPAGSGSIAPEEAVLRFDAAKKRLPGCVQSFRGYQKKITKGEFEAAFSDVYAMTEPVFRSLDEAVCAMPDETDARLLESANAFLDELELDWAANRNRNGARDDDKMVIAIFLVPAIRKLELEGLVLMIPRKGAEVAKISEKSLRDVLEVRRSLEELAAELACQRMDAEALKDLEDAQKAFIQAVESGETMTMAEADEHFHDVIYMGTGNTRLVQILNNLREQMYRYRLEYIKDADKRQILMVEHEHILKALTLRHIQEAKMAVREHIDNQEITILKNLKEQENDIQRKVPGRRN